MVVVAPHGFRAVDKIVVKASYLFKARLQWLVVVSREKHPAMNLAALEIFAGLAVREDLGLVTAEADIAQVGVFSELHVPAVAWILLADRAAAALAVDVVKAS